MHKITFVFLLIFFSLYLSAQNSDILVDANGSVIPEKKSKSEKLPSKPEDVINYFYANIPDAPKLGNVLSFRFYQKTPAYKFKEIMATISNATGKLLSKEIISHEYSPDKKSIMYTIRATYEKQTTKEIIILIQESPGNRFEVYEYQIKKG